MNLTLPVYVEERKGARASQGKASEYLARPLFADGPLESDPNLNRALRRLARELRKKLAGLGRSPRHDQLAGLTFNPLVQEHRLNLELELRRQILRGRFLFLTFSALGRRVAFSPALPDLWFTISRGQTLPERAREVLTEHYKREEKDGVPLAEMVVGIEGRAFVTTLELEVGLDQKIPAKPKFPFAMLGGTQGPMDGATELQKVGRCLDWLYPDDLTRAILRDAEVDELSQALADRGQRPVLLLGPRGVGKTALIHEAVARRVEARKATHNRENVWLLAPQRLISGMSYVGQWENRILAILRHAKKKKHVLYFDDLLGLYQAGVSGNSALSVAHVLKPWVERREARILAEMSPEELRVFQEQDRGFADMFHVIRLREPSEEATLRILIRLQRRLEGNHRCRFELEALPTALALQRSFVREVAFPGKAAGFLEQLAVKLREQEISRETVLREFQRKTGLSVSFLDERVKLTRKQVLEDLRADVIGQDAALQAIADVVTTAKARLNDPGRPLAAFLFLGPTGVGKTHCAKALARYLFGDEERLVRFDMNEYVSPYSVPQLIGTFREPDGLLTGALRRQPFSVVLLDEIEKAHPDVFDLLLQVLGEGRLSDARGRTADFSNAIVLMTSNLGVREAESNVGFREEPTQSDLVYVREAERFFRPELFNRIDRVLPFQRLSREEVERIARLLLASILQRDGFVRRRCTLDVYPGALDQVVEEGYHPQLGARALKRAIEGNLTAQAAERLASLSGEAPTVASLLRQPDGVGIHLQALSFVDPLPRGEGFEPSHDDLRLLREDTFGIEDSLAGERPAGGIIDVDSYEQGHYFEVREEGRRIRKAIGQLGDGLDHVARARRARRAAQVGRPHRRLHRLGTQGLGAGEPDAAFDPSDYLRDLSGRAAPLDVDFAHRFRRLRRSVWLMQAMARNPQPARLLVWARARDVLFRGTAIAVGDVLCGALEQASGAWAQALRPLNDDRLGRAILAGGPCASVLLEGEVGTHLFVGDESAIVPVQVEVHPVPSGREPLDLLAEVEQRQAGWLERVAAGEAACADDPHSFGPVVRVYDALTMTIDLRTGLMVHGIPNALDQRDFMLARLPEWEG